ncbi:MAG: hypothetical protein ABIA75_10470 [Candidatus Neomarinimicrobiota bacterium]
MTSQRIVIILWLLFQSTIPTSAQNFYQLLPILLNDYRLERFTIARLNQSGTEYFISHSVNDYYRQTLTGKEIVACQNWERIAGFTNIRPGNICNYGFTIRAGSPVSDFQNREEAGSITGHYRQNGWNASLLAALTNNNLLLGGGLQTAGNTSQTPLVINNYPVSDDKNLNKYFLNYLEPAFGRDLDLEISISHFQPRFFATLPISNEYKLNLNYCRTQMVFDTRLCYTNTSNIDQLTGLRTVTSKGKFLDQVLEMGVGASRSDMTPAITIFKTALEIDVANQLAEGIITDFRELGWITGDRTGGAIKIDGTKNNFNYSIGLGYSNISASADLTTPVLGRYILPVAHAAGVEIAGPVTSQNIKIGYRWSGLKYTFHTSTGYYHGYYDFRLKGTARLEFDLASMPIDYPLRYYLHLFEIIAGAQRQFGHFTVGYEFGFFPPILKRADDSPIKFQHPKKIAGVTRRGAFRHLLAIHYDI